MLLGQRARRLALNIARPGNHYRTVYGHIGFSHPSDSAEAWIKDAIGYLDVDKQETPREQVDMSVTMFTRSILPEYDLADPDEQKKFSTIWFFAKTVQQAMEQSAQLLFDQTNVIV